MRRNSGAPSSERGERKKERGRGKRVGGDEEIRSGEVHVDTGICNRQLGLLSATRKHLGPEINYSGGEESRPDYYSTGTHVFSGSSHLLKWNIYPVFLKPKLKAQTFSFNEATLFVCGV